MSFPRLHQVQRTLPERLTPMNTRIWAKWWRSLYCYCELLSIHKFNFLFDFRYNCPIKFKLQLYIKGVSFLGIFSWIVCIISVSLSIKYGRMMLEPIVHIQSVMMLVLSSNSVGEYWIEYLSWIQYFKFDFGLISSFILNNSKICTRSYGKLVNLKLYYEETIWNYFILIILALFVFIFLIIIQCWKQKASKFIL